LIESAPVHWFLFFLSSLPKYFLPSLLSTRHPCPPILFSLTRHVSFSSPIQSRQPLNPPLHVGQRRRLHLHDRRPNNARRVEESALAEEVLCHGLRRCSSSTEFVASSHARGPRPLAHPYADAFFISLLLLREDLIPPPPQLVGRH
jgi:hypothetical protein